MNKLGQLILSIIFIISFISCDLVNNLPDYPFKGRMYSGYLNLDNPKKKLHYLFIESANSPSTDPIILWLNGGPGCSSLLGWAQEHGPASFGDDSDVFTPNPYSWHKLANMIYLESPAGVGFSYLDSNKEEDLLVNDKISGLENLQGVLDFFKKYPSLKNNDFYIAGESYAGIYVPTLATNIVEWNKKQMSSKRINLKGFMVGNGVTDWKVDTTPAIWDFAYSHALYGPELRKKYLENCVNQLDQEECDRVETKISIALSNVNIYDVYRKCYGEGNSQAKLGLSSGYKYTPWLLEKRKNTKKETTILQMNNFLSYLEETQYDFTKKPQLKLTPPCVDSKGPDEYFNRADVKAALNVRSEMTWEMCSEEVNNSYQRSDLASFHLYPQLIEAKLKILIFSGDTDAAVPINGTQKWISNLNLPVKSPWRSWKVNDSSLIAGYRTIYEGLTFVSVMGTGHMVPQWKPKEAFYMVKSFIRGDDL